MPTVNTIIQRAFQSNGIVRVGQAPSADNINYALGVLNEMLDKWASEGIAHGLNDVEASTQVYNGALSSAIRKNLQVELVNGPYEAQLSPLLLQEAIQERINLMPFDDELEYDSSLTQRQFTEY